VEDIRNELKWIGKCSLFLFGGMLIECFLPNRFPFYALSTVYYLVLSVLVIRYFYERLAGYGYTRSLLLSVAVMILTIFLLRGLKYSFFYDSDTVRRFLWYLYYIPFLLIPLFIFYVALAIGAQKKIKMPPWLILITLVSLLFIVGVLTNDLHESFFIFDNGIDKWDVDYSHGIPFYLLIVWEYLMYLGAIITMMVKCRLGVSRRVSYVMLIPFTVSMVLIIGNYLDLFQINGVNILEILELKSYMTISIIGCAVESGLIQSKEKPENMFKMSSLPVQISDKSGKCIYSSGSAELFDGSPEAFSGETSALELGDTIIRRYNLGNCYGYWQEDVSKINSLNENLSEKQEELKEENELVRLENELQEKKKRVIERDLIYDRISQRTERVAAKIHEYSRLAEGADSACKIRELSRKVCFLGVYIKRFSNLYLLASRNETVKIMELSLALRELLICVNDMDIPCEHINDVDADISGDKALEVFELVEKVIEDNIDALQGVYIRIIREDRVLLKITLEGEKILVKDLPCVCEDDVTYIKLPLEGRDM